MGLPLPVGEALGLLARADQLDDGIEKLVELKLLLLLQNQHEVVAEARLHHHPVDGSGQVDVGCEKHYVLTWQATSHNTSVGNRLDSHHLSSV